MDQTIPQNRDDSRETKLIWSHKSNMYHVRSIAPCINNLGLITSSHNRLNQQKMACQVGNHAHQMSMMVMVWFGLVDSLHSTMQGFSPFHKKNNGSIYFGLMENGTDIRRCCYFNPITFKTHAGDGCKYYQP